MAVPKQDVGAFPSNQDQETYTILCKVCSLHHVTGVDGVTTSAPEGAQPELAAEPEVDPRGDSPEETIFYLAYGSNLSQETFLGKRGIRPLSAVNVHCPSLALCFDLPGMPYLEPCFANTRPSSEANPLGLEYRKPARYDEKRWVKGLIGVVYEVTPKDFATIIATEGGGSGYQDIIVDCYTLPKDKESVDDKPTGRPFKAHTLYCPPRPHGITRPDPDYAQASARYLKLIRDGANEHSLPQEYREYLDSLQSYTVTTIRQMVGKAIFTAIWAPFMLALITGAKIVADEKGLVPKWYARMMDAAFTLIWYSYDAVFKGMFGDGERTVTDGDEVPVMQSLEDEKRPLLSSEVSWCKDIEKQQR